MTAPGYADLMVKLSSSGTYEDNAAFTPTVVTSYREMGVLIPILDLKQ